MKKLQRILVTGGTGYIGSHTVVELIQAGYEVVILDNLHNSKIETLDKIEKITGVRPKFYKVDLLDYAKVSEILREAKCEAVMHFAGLKAVAESVEHPLDYYENNLTGTINLLKAMRETGVKNLVFSSSATVYGEQGEDLYSEAMRVGMDLANPYGRTKYMIEEIIRDVAAADPEFRATILRYFNPIGAHESGLLGEDPNDIPNNLMPIVLKVDGGEIKELQVFGDDYPTRDGSCIRDFIHVVDLAKGHIATLENLTPGVKAYNLGTGHGTSVLELITAFEKVSGRKLKYKIVGRRVGDLAVVCADPSLAKEELGWEANKTIEMAIEDALRFCGRLG